MEHRRHRKNKKKIGTRSTATAKGPIRKEVTSIGEFRATYLPGDEKRKVANQMTPKEVGEEIARTSLDAAKDVLNEDESPRVANRKAAAAGR